MIVYCWLIVTPDGKKRYGDRLFDCPEECWLDGRSALLSKFYSIEGVALTLVPVATHFLYKEEIVDIGGLIKSFEQKHGRFIQVEGRGTIVQSITDIA